MITNLEQLYFNQIQDLCSAESQLLGILPQMAAFASRPDLRNAFRDCLRDSRTHFSHLTEIREIHGIAHETLVCDAMKGMVLETKKHLTKTVPGEVRDAVLIASGNRIEHYGIACYGVAKAFADCLGFDRDSEMLAEMLGDASGADAVITKIATGGIFRSGINQAASMV
jgi:ferritin-like metal-binding protein YciE